MQVVECFYNFHFDRDALDFSRFTVHLRFFAQRVFQGKQEQENDTHDEVFRALIARNCQVRKGEKGEERRHQRPYPEAEEGAFGRGTGVPYHPSETDLDGEISFLFHL